MPTDARAKFGTGGPWGTGFLVLGFAVIAQGAGYFTAEPGNLAPALAALSQIVPPWVWGLVWVGIGVWCIARALRPPQRPWDILPVVTLFATWAAAYFTYWLILGLGDGNWDRSWSGAVGWGMLTGLIICWGRCVNPPRRVS